MSLIAARKKRTSLYLSVVGLMIVVAAVSAISARDPSGVWLRVGMIMVTVGAGLWLPWRQVIPVVLLAWLVPNYGRSVIDDVALSNLNMLLELPGLVGVGFLTVMARVSLNRLEQESVLIGTGNSDLAGLNPDTGIHDENQLRTALSSELARSRRFNRPFSLMLVGIDEMRQKFDYRDDAVWQASLNATKDMLRQTRFNVDRVFHFGDDGFAIILPEATEKDITGLVKRLRHLARSMKPAEGEAGGPMPVHFGATFFPDCATTVDDLLRRAEIALRIAASNTTTRYQLDSAEAPALPPPVSLRRECPPDTGSETSSADASSADQASSDGTDRADEPAWQSVMPVFKSVAEKPPLDSTEEHEEVNPAAVSDRAPEVESTADVPDAPQEEAAFLPKLKAAEAVTASIAEPETSPDRLVAREMSASLASESDELEALLQQMDETLKMIRSARDHAA